MGRTRLRAGYVTISADVDVDVGEVLEEADTGDLVSELRDRAKKGDAEASAALGTTPEVFGMGSWESETLIEAVRRDDGRRVVDMLRPVFR